jgi:hypothetical protein
LESVLGRGNTQADDSAIQALDVDAEHSAGQGFVVVRPLQSGGDRVPFDIFKAEGLRRLRLGRAGLKAKGNITQLDDLTGRQDADRKFDSAGAYGG